MTLIEIESYKLVVTNSFASEIESQRSVTPADLIALDSSENERRESVAAETERRRGKKLFSSLVCCRLCVSLIGGYHLREGCCIRMATL
jgi:hypothetical protein